jgi:deazaflavin-dependent oxidoreductase (nitroreductase family)
MTRLDAQRWPARWAGEPFLYRTTIGRRTGRRHRIEIWIAGHDGRLYLMSGGRDRADWVRNLKLNQRVTVELGNETYEGVAHSIRPNSAEDRAPATC